jgi:flagellar basal-body rod protein FlgB
MKGLVAILIMLITASASAESGQRIALLKPEQRAAKQHQTNDLFKSYLEASAYRNKVLSQNLANVNTPGYKADEVTMPSSLNELSGSGKTTHSVRMKVTSDKHIHGSKGKDGKFISHKLKDPDEVKKNGNNVSLRQQMTKLSQNKSDYTAAVKGYATVNSLFSSVLSK